MGGLSLPHLLILALVVTLLVFFTVLGFMGITSKLFVFPFLLEAAGATVSGCQPHDARGSRCGCCKYC